MYKIYAIGDEPVHALDGVSLSIDDGEFVAIMGSSGSGKSTMLNILGCLDVPTKGSYLLDGLEVAKRSPAELARIRCMKLGFVFQNFNLLPRTSALENVELPLVFKRVRGGKRKRLARKILKQVGLGGRMRHKPKEMSGGQQQRVGIARAFVSKPDIVFADEPTGNLDSHTTIEVMELIKSMAEKNNQTIVMVTHDRKLSEYADKIIHILDGKIESVEIVDHTAAGNASPPEENGGDLSTTVEQNPQDNTEESKGIEE